MTLLYPKQLDKEEHIRLQLRQHSESKLLQRRKNVIQLTGSVLMNETREPERRSVQWESSDWIRLLNQLGAKLDTAAIAGV